jgi:hypothetical protein
LRDDDLTRFPLRILHNHSRAAFWLRKISISQPHSLTGEAMKKNRDADELAARIAAAANQPAAFVSSPPPKIAPEPETAAQPVQAGTSKAKRRPRKEKLTDGDTVGISLRPHRALLSRYVLKAADRTREAGRVISAQEIMLEVLERSA